MMFHVIDVAFLLYYAIGTNCSTLVCHNTVRYSKYFFQKKKKKKNDVFGPLNHSVRHVLFESTSPDAAPNTLERGNLWPLSLVNLTTNGEQRHLLHRAPLDCAVTVNTAFSKEARSRWCYPGASGDPTAPDEVHVWPLAGRQSKVDCMRWGGVTHRSKR